MAGAAGDPYIDSINIASINVALIKIDGLFRQAHTGPMTLRTVETVMSSPAVVVAADDTLAEAARSMHASHVGSVVVIRDGCAEGIVTERDLLRTNATGADPTTVKVGEVMSAPVDVMDRHFPAREALLRLRDRGYRHMPVVDELQHVIGVVSLRDLMRVADIALDTETVEVPRGLKGVVVTETEVGDVRGREGFFHYRQYDATELARYRSFEDVWFLMFEGRLPTPVEREEFVEEAAALRWLPDAITAMLPGLASAAAEDTSLASLAGLLAMVGAVDGARPVLDLTPQERRRDALRLCALTPTVLCALHRLRRGLPPLEPRPELGHAANYLWMQTGVVPDPVLAKAVETYLVLTVDHGFNASTFTGRVITSTGASVPAAVAGALGALSGPLHGGAPSRALAALDEIGSPEHIDDWVRDRIVAGDKLMGFGHAVYRTQDPRSSLLKEVAVALGGATVDFAQQVEERVVALLNELKPGRELYANVEFYAGVVMDRCGLDRDMFTPTFAVSRVVGWCANILEQAAEGKIIRPSARYVGPPPPQPVPR